MDLKVKLIEELSLNALPALQKKFFDGWILQFSNGYTYRANCICPIYNTENNNIEGKVKKCEREYNKKGIPTVFKITDYTNPKIDNLLETLGYSIVKNVDIMTLKLDGYVTCDYTNIQVSDTLDKEWFEAFINLSNIKNLKNEESHRKMLKNIKGNLICVKAVVEKKIVGCGLGVMEDDYVGLFDIRVKEDYRRQGIATNICSAIINKAVDNDVKEAYLQVLNKNDKAINLYKKLGFKRLYQYWFREKEEENNKISD